MTISAYIPGTPRPQPRVKAYSRGGHAGVYTPDTADAWKQEIALAMREYAGVAIAGPIWLTMSFYIPRPKSHYGTGKNARVLKPQSPKFHTNRGDVDNFCKGAMDCLTTCKVWKDDAQVVSLKAEKFWADDAPGMALMIMTK